MSLCVGPWISLRIEIWCLRARVLLGGLEVRIRRPVSGLITDVWPDNLHGENYPTADFVWPKLAPLEKKRVPFLAGASVDRVAAFRHLRVASVS
jgi:hypothetical protein